MRPWIRCGGAAMLLVTLTACSTLETAGIAERPGDLPAAAEVDGVPFFAQQKYYCGPAALAMVLAWSGLPVTQDDLVDEVYTPSREGSLTSDVLAAARRHGRVAVPVGSLRDLLAEVAAGNPVVVFQNLALDWLPQWHYAVAIGYDLNQGTMVLHSGVVARRAVELDVFQRTWKRGGYWALAVLPPGRRSASAGLGPLLEAAAGLERAARFTEAAKTYAAIARRWPRSFAAYMGLGNARYAMEDFSGAESAFREALDRRPEAAAWNNLGYALAAQGRRRDALEAVETAVRLGGERRRAYEESLQELKRTQF